MEKRDLRILVVDDDPTLALAMEEVLKRAGYTVRRVADYNEAKAASKISDFHGLVVDCMLPQKNGVDLAAEIRKESQEDPVIILTSGIYKDKNFAREASNKTKANSFLFKPFDINELVQIFDQAFVSHFGETSEPIHSLLAKKDYSTQDRVRAVESSGSLHGFDLPLVYSLLAKKGICGDLEITFENKVKSIVGFQDGRIDKVIHHDEESYFGVLLVEKGFTTLEAVEEGLALVDDRPLGKRLVDNSTLSPHAVEIIQHEQMIIRLSKTIQNTSIDLKFNPETREAKVAIEPPTFNKLLGDWISSKLTEAWLLSFYTSWLDRPIVRGPEHSKLELLVGHHILKPLKTYFKQSEWPHSLQDLLESTGAQEGPIIRAIHFLLLNRVLVFAPNETKGIDWTKRLARLKKIDASMKNQNHFEVLGVSTKARASEIHRSYQELAKTLHPDRLPPDVSAEVKDLTHKIFTKITEAFQVLQSDKKRENYLKTLEMGLAEEILFAETVFEQGFNLLQSGRYRDARKTFEKALKMKGHRTDLMVYLIWAYICEKRNSAPSLELYEKVKSMIAQVAHEDRHSPHYFFVRGLSYELCGEFEKSMSAFKHTLTLEPGFAEARKEIALVRRLAAKHKTTLSDELSQVVTKFFKPKKRSG